MSKRSNIKITALLVLSVGLMAAAATAYLLAFYYRHICFQMLGGFCESIIEKNPNARQDVLGLLKRTGENIFLNKSQEHILSKLGYDPSNLGITDTAIVWSAVFVFLAGGILFFFSFWYVHKKLSARIQALTDYLEKINTGDHGLLLDFCEDEFSRLQDEIYKTVTTLYQTRAAAITARNNFAENLSNIAHQLKTPITSISLTIQMAKEYLEDVHDAQMSQGHTTIECKMYANMKDIERQINRLMHLEEALLLLSRIDAGTLTLERRPTDVFTILTLASDHLQELFARKGVCLDVPEMGEIEILVDLDWTMEAFMNLMKNCMEAAQTDTTVHCSYEKNPLFVQIRIWDEGDGFEKEDLPHLFERFYRGEKAKYTGIGIGLSLSKAIIEMQNGIIRAFNLQNGGACFEIRFYVCQK
ncbi:MAG: HAMP domain-containing histidine kinase [Eubacterium sp.]|nr:HAMP domain-containing histidine kinase [Eubacterium sp.]